MGRREMNKDRGAAIIVLIMVIAFLMTVGILLLFVTGTGPEVAGNVRLQERAFNAAEAGFDAVWRLLNETILSGAMVDFSGQYRTTYNGQPLDIPPTESQPNPYYFRLLTDEQLVKDFENDPTNVIFLNQPLANDLSLSYTVFLINDEAAPGVTPNDRDCIVVCIGRAARNTYARIEVVIEIQEST